VLFLASWKVLLMCKLEEDNCHVFNFFEFIIIKNFGKMLTSVIGALVK
jgi:hypothetical protein